MLCNKSKFEIMTYISSYNFRLLLFSLEYIIMRLRIVMRYGLNIIMISTYYYCYYTVG